MVKKMSFCTGVKDALFPQNMVTAKTSRESFPESLEYKQNQQYDDQYDNYHA